jgi:hypothetical protein
MPPPRSAVPARPAQPRPGRGSAWPTRPLLPRSERAARKLGRIGSRRAGRPQAPSADATALQRAPSAPTSSGALCAGLGAAPAGHGYPKPKARPTPHVFRSTCCSSCKIVPYPHRAAGPAVPPRTPLPPPLPTAVGVPAARRVTPGRTAPCPPAALPPIRRPPRRDTTARLRPLPPPAEPWRPPAGAAAAAVQVRILRIPCQMGSKAEQAQCRQPCPSMGCPPAGCSPTQIGCPQAVQARG